MSLQNENSVERGSRSKKKKSRGFDGNQRCDSSSTSASSEVAVAPQQQWNTAPWQCQLANSKQRLTCMLESSRLHDQVFTFNDGSSIKAHRLLLAMCSPVFEAMFFGPNSEGPSVHLPEDPPEAFAWILRYCYTDHVSLPNVDTALQIYQLAHRYQMDSLVAICKDYFAEQLSPHNLPEIYNIATLHDDPQLIQQCTSIISKCPSVTFSSSSFVLLSQRSMKHLMQQELQMNRETDIFNAIIKWGRGQLEGQSAMSTELRKEIEEFLPKIRFLTMSTNEFVDHVMSCNILTMEENEAILKNIRQLPNIPVPPICSPCQERRYPFDESLLVTWKIFSSSLIDQSDPEFNRFDVPNKFVEKTITWLTNVKVNKPLHLRKIEAKFNGLTPPSVVVKGKDGQMVQCAVFVDGAAKFSKPFALEPDNIYSFCSSFYGFYNTKTYESVTEGLNCIKGEICSNCSAVFYLWEF